MRRMMMLAMMGLATGAAQAQEPHQDQMGRYQMERSGDGFVRLDTTDGTMTLCREKDGTLTCRMGADERAAFEEELQRLEKRVEALEARGAGGNGIASAPTDAEIDRSIGIMERFMRAFFGLVKEFEADKAEQQPPPQRS